MLNNDLQNISPTKYQTLNEEELEAMAGEYPYFSLAQFWLLSNNKKTQNKNLEKQAQKTALFFANSKWLHWQLFHQNTSQNILINKDVKTSTEQSISQNKSEDLIAFEPLHTVDYFASQGIKINEETLSNDKLGAQLKSFTEWLKSMKKINASAIPETLDEQADKQIQDIAESSNANINVVTEAMAEVFLKQGKVEQARSIYEKLSLNYPLRSAYFADKINSLK